MRTGGKMSNKLKGFHERILQDFNRIQTAVKKEREQCLEDRKFYSISGAQWEGNLEEQFENKPKFEVNKVHLAVIKIINEYRNNRISVNFITKDGSSGDSLADACDGLFRSDEQDSSAQEAYDNAFEEAVGGGFGAFRLVSEYEDDEDDEDTRQRIRFEPIYDADMCVFFDLDSRKQDKSDAKYCFVLYAMTPEDYEEEWGDDPSTMPKNVGTAESFSWSTPDVVYIAEYYKVELQKEKNFEYENLLGDSEWYSEADFEDADLKDRLAAEGKMRISTKVVKRKKIHKYIISGSKVLEDCGVLAGKHIPIVPVYGKRWVVDSVERVMGHVRLVKDTQRLKNMLTSKLAEISSISPVEKPIFSAEQIVGHEKDWSDDNIKNLPYLLVNPITGPDGNEMPSGPLGYTKAPDIPQALSALMQIVDIDTKELLGNSGEADKIVSHVSGKAHEMVQKRIDGQAFIYMSNFSKAIHRTGQIWLSMARELYTEKDRKMKTYDSLGQSDQVALGQSGLSKNGEIETKNDLTKASFDVTVDVGPSSSSQRESTVNSLIPLLQITQDPQTQKVLQSMILLNMEGDGMSQTREYFRKQLVEMGVLTPTKEEAEAMEKNKQPSANDQALLAMAEEARAKATSEQAKIQEILSDSELKKAKAAEVLAGISRDDLKAVVDAVSAQQKAAEARAKIEIDKKKQK